MTYDLRFSPSAGKAFEKARQPLAGKLARCFERLQQDPASSNNATQLSSFANVKGEPGGRSAGAIGIAEVNLLNEDAA